MKNDRLRFLLRLHLRGELSSSEFQELADYLSNQKVDESLTEEYIAFIADETKLVHEVPVPSEEMYEHIIKDKRFNKRTIINFSSKPTLKWIFWCLAIFIVILLVIALCWLG